MKAIASAEVVLFITSILFILFSMRSRKGKARTARAEEGAGDSAGATVALVADLDVEAPPPSGEASEEEAGLLAPADLDREAAEQDGVEEPRRHRKHKYTFGQKILRNIKYDNKLKSVASPCV
jgi:hypothetical protein